MCERVCFFVVAGVSGVSVQLLLVWYGFPRVLSPKLIVLMRWGWNRPAEIEAIGPKPFESVGEVGWEWI